MASAGGARPAGVRQHRPRGQCQPAQPGQAGQRQALQARVRADDRRPRRQPAAERDALVPDRARRRTGRPILGEGDRQLQRVHRRDDRRDRVDQRRCGGASLHRRGRLRRLHVGARRSQDRLLGSRRGGAGRRPVLRVPALSRAARPRAGPVPGGRPEGAVVHLARQPRRADPGQRARQYRPLPRDRGRLPEGVPERGVRSVDLPGQVRRRAVRRLQRPGLHPAAAGQRRGTSRPTPTARSSRRRSTGR